MIQKEIKMKLKKLFVYLCCVCCMTLLGCSNPDIKVTCNFENSSMEEDLQLNFESAVTEFVDKVSEYDNNIDIDELRIYVEDNVTNIGEANAIHINTNETDKVETFLKIYLELNGAESNAGEAYGFAAQIYEECGLGEVENRYTEDELAACFSDAERMYLLDFTLPMLETSFFDEETVSYVKDAALDFVDYCIEKYGMQKAYRLCMDTTEKGHEKLVELKNDWLVEIGATETYEECEKLSFSYNYNEVVPGYPYVIASDSSKWYFSPLDVKTYGYCAFIDAYTEIVPVAEMDFAEARELLKDYIPENLPSVNIYTKFSEVDGVNQSAIYYVDRSAIYLYEDWSLIKYNILHEYIHHLTRGEGKLFQQDGGLVEGVTEAIATYECESHLKGQFFEEYLENETYGKEWYEFADAIGVLNSETNQVDFEVYAYYRAKYYYDLEPQEAEYTALNQSTIAKPSRVTLNALSYAEACSMSKYLFEQYGMEETLKNCTDIVKLQKMTGRSFSELYEDWGAWNEQKYQEVRIK